MVQINQRIFDKYKEFADDFINDNFGVNCKLIYPPKETECVNCVFDSIGRKSSNRYKHGGPQPFNFGNCPTCSGKGFREDEATENIKLRVYYEKKSWVKIAGGTFNADDSDAQVIGFIHDMPKFDMANEIELDSDLKDYKTLSYTKAGDSFPHGFKHDRYFISHLRRTS